MVAVSEFLVSQGNPGLIAKGTRVAPPRGSGGPLLLAFPGAGSFLKRKGVGDCRRIRLVNPILRPTVSYGGVIPLATASREESDADVEKVKSEIEKQVEETKEVWMKTIESLKLYAVNMQNTSQEAYELYSQQAVLILKKMSEQLKVQAEKARQDMTNLAEGISIEGKQYLSTAAENCPEPMKDIVETFASQGPELREISEVRDFFIGIPYGGLLSLGGFLSFMLTGSIPSIRFGMVLGGALLSLSILSLRAWKEGKSSPLFLKGQVGIAAILFVRELGLFCQESYGVFPEHLMSGQEHTVGKLQLQKLACSMRPCIWTAAVALISGSILAFYAYRIKVESHTEGGESKKLM